jgi:N-acyl-D-amino-acid deacylase
MVKRSILLALLVLSGLAGLRAHSTPQAAAADSFDLIIRNARVMDGSGNPWMRADVAVRNGRIAAIGRLDGAAAARVIDARDRYVAPGFIDVHSHAAPGLARDGLRQGQPLLAQGVTTIVANPDGGGPIDLAKQRADLERGGLGVNVMLLIGHGSVRSAVMGSANRKPTEDEMSRMETLVRAGMREGAYGLSSGLYYVPGFFATTEEVIALAKVAGEAGGLYTSHIRDEGNYSVGVVAAVQEVIRVAEEANVIGIVSHMKTLGPDNWGLSVACTTRIDQARARGVQVFADQYPYEASSTGLVAALLPGHEGGREALLKRLADPDARLRLLASARENLRRRGGPASIVMAFYAADRGLEGKSLADIAASRGAPPAETALDLIERGDASIVSFNMSEADIAHIMRQPYTMTSSDGDLVPMGAGRPHPRNYGAHARKLAVYARERGVVTLESAVRSMTSLPAAVFGLTDRGVIRPGAWADLAVFDPNEIRDRATYTEPHQLAAGMAFVLVNGQVVIEDGTFTKAMPGRVLKRNAP